MINRCVCVSLLHFLGKIKIWDLKAALDPRIPTNQLCIKTLNKHTGRVFRLQFDEFQIIRLGQKMQASNFK